MCGIAGYLELNDAPSPTPELVGRMLAQIRHRGPDEFGIFVNDRVGMGNARLSIVDLAGGIQPISNEAGDVWIVYNGEVFNYPELRAELEARGHVFQTHTDTEIIVHLYEDHGPDCLRRLNGQWAIALWDGRKRELFLARDRMGVRPLFYTVAGGTLVFGSEIKSLFAHPKVRRTLDPLGVSQVFQYWTPISPHTCFEGVREIPPGHFAIVRNAAPEPRAYWRLGFPEETRSDRSQVESGKSAQTTCDLRPPTCDREAAERLRELLLDATRIRLRADVPVGAYLSGGLDSSIIAAMVRKLGIGHLDTFSIAFSDPEFDESEPQRRMARFLGTEHQVVEASHADIARVLPDVIWHTEVPLTRTAPVPMYLLSRLVNDRRYKVVLTGEGADEFLGGYDIFKEAKIRRFWARDPASKVRPQLLRRLYPEISRLGGSAPSFLAAFFGQGLEQTDAPDYSHAVRWRNNARCLRFFTEEFAAELVLRRQDTGPDIAYPREFGSWGPFQQAQYLEATLFLSGYLLSSQGDRMAMANAVEGRYPFLDYRVIEFCNTLPAEMKMKALCEKWILREAFKGWLPDDVLRRRKRPYRAPIYRTFAADDTPAYVAEILGEANMAALGLFKPAAGSRLLQAIRQGRPLGETDEMALVGMLTTGLLHRQFVSGYRVRPDLAAADRVKLVDRRTGALTSPPGS